MHRDILKKASWKNQISQLNISFYGYLHTYQSMPKSSNQCKQFKKKLQDLIKIKLTRKTKLTWCIRIWSSWKRKTSISRFVNTHALMFNIREVILILSLIRDKNIAWTNYRVSTSFSFHHNDSSMYRIRHYLSPRIFAHNLNVIMTQHGVIMWFASHGTSLRWKLGTNQLLK